MEFTFGLMAGFMLWPVWAMAGFMTLLTVDVVLCQTDEYGWGFATLVGFTAFLSWLATDINPFIYTYQHLSDFVRFFLVWGAIGGVWSLVKWGLYSRNMKKKVIAGTWMELGQYAKWDWNKLPDAAKRNIRPPSSYFGQNTNRLVGWIAMWPFSMLAFLVGDFLRRVTEIIREMLRGIYEQISNWIWGDFKNMP